MEKPPRWTDEDAVSDWVIKKLALFNLSKFKTGVIAELMNPPVNSPHRIEIPYQFSKIIERAIEEAERGNFMVLAHLLHPAAMSHFPGFPDASWWRAHFSDKAWRLIAARLVGKHKAKRGGRRKDGLNRALSSPVHCASLNFPCIRQALRQAYPEQKKSQIYNRALEVAARLQRIEPTTLSNYLRRSKNDRRRLTESA